jgi:hypothetical protein
MTNGARGASAVIGGTRASRERAGAGRGVPAVRFALETGDTLDADTGLAAAAAADRLMPSA